MLCSLVMSVVNMVICRFVMIGLQVKVFMVFFQHVRSFSAFTLLVGWQEGHPACKKTEWWGAGMVICLERGTDLHTAQLMPLPFTVSCFSKIQIGFTFLVPADLDGPGKRASKHVCVVDKHVGFQIKLSDTLLQLLN